MPLVSLLMRTSQPVQRLREAFHSRFRACEAEKAELALEAVRHHWRVKSRLFYFLERSRRS